MAPIWPPGIERTLRLSLPPNHAATGDPVISGTVQVGAELTALTDGIMDDDVLDDVFTYQWVRVDADGTSNEEDISDETDATYTLTADERGKKVKVEVRFVDILGGEETRTSAPTATLAGTPNIPATGAPTITGTAQVGETLTASTTGIADANGLTSPTYTYQWIRVDGTDEADIASANSSTYILVDADLGTTLKVKVTFADDLGHTETLTSAATATVGAVATGPPTVNDVAVTSTPASGTTYYLAGEVIEFTVTFSAPVTVTATPKFAFRLGAATRQAAYASGSEQRGVGVRPDGAGRRGRSQRHLVECDRARPRRRDHHADGRDDGREPDPRRAGAAGGAPGGRRPADAGLGVGAWDVAGAGLRRAARSGLDAGDGRVYGDGDGRSHHHEPGGVGGVDIRHLGDAGTGRGAGCGRDGDAGVRAAGVEPGAGRGGQRCAGVQRPVGEAGPAAAAGPCAGDGGGGRPGQRAAGGDLDGGGQRHGLHGAVDVERTGLQHRRPAGHGHDGVDHALHDSQPHQRHGIHGAGDRDPDRRRRRPALGRDDGDAESAAAAAATAAGDEP